MENIVRKGEIALQAISPLTMFSTLYGTYFPFWMHFKISSAICFNSDQSKPLLSGNGLRRGAVSEQWSLKAADCLIQVVSNTGLTVPRYDLNFSQTYEPYSAKKGFNAFAKKYQHRAAGTNLDRYFLLWVEFSLLLLPPCDSVGCLLFTTQSRLTTTLIKLFETLWEKEKMLVTSIFSFSQCFLSSQYKTTFLID